MPAAASHVRVGRTQGGYSVRVEGRGTMRESPAVYAFLSESLEREPVTVAVDLTACDYLDSTFLGCLLGLHKRFGRSAGPRFVIAADAEHRKKLLGPTRLDVLLKPAEAAPPTIGPWVE